MAETTSEKRTKRFREIIEKLQSRILNSLENVAEVMRQLGERDVIKISQEELDQFKYIPSLRAQKEKLINLLLGTDFKAMKIIIKVLGETPNASLKSLLQFYRHEILKEFPKAVNNNQVDAKNESSLDSPHQTPLSRSPNFGYVSNGYESDTETEPDTEVIKTDSRKSRRHSTISIENEAKNCSECSFLTLFQAASGGDVHFLTETLDSELYVNKLGLRPCQNCLKKTRGRTLLHAAVLANNYADNSSDVVECIEVLLSKLKLHGDVTDAGTGTSGGGSNFSSVNELLNEKDELGQTAVHLAAENKREKVVEKLYYDYNCDILIKNKFGQTALDLISKNTPKVMWGILNKEKPLILKSNESFTEEITLTIDFGPIIGYRLGDPNENNTLKNKSLEAADNYSEMLTLMKCVIQGKRKASDHLLTHVMVETFVSLKWKRLSPYVYSYMIFKVLIYLWYTLFVLHVFLASCPTSEEVQPSPPSTEANSFPTEIFMHSKSIWDYLFRGWKSVLRAFTNLYAVSQSPTDDESDSRNCNFQNDWQPLLFFVLGFVLLLHEIWEAIILNRVQNRKQKFFAAYWRSWENWIQILFNVLMIIIGSIAFKTSIPNYYYTYAALSVVVTWALIFTQVGYLAGHGIYVLIIGKITKRFLVLMINYSCWIIAFSMALSILFPQESAFETLPKSFLRVIMMMTGEINYEDTFYGQTSGNRTTTGTGTGETPVSSILFSAHIVYVSLALLLTIVLTNTLIGLAVSDVNELQDKSEVLLRSIKVSNMYTMEAALLKIRLGMKRLDRKLNLKLCQKRLMGFNCFADIFNIFVIHPSSIWNEDGDGKPTGNGMVLVTTLKELNVSKKLKEKLLEFAMK